MQTTRIVIVLIAALILASQAFAADADVRIKQPSLNRLDAASLQRGAQIFVNYCLNCHSANYMRYNRLQDLGLTEKQIEANLMFASDKVGDTMKIALSKIDAEAWFGVQPPDLTLVARVRGTQWLYGYLRGFYKDEQSRSGWNNLIFPNVSMPHVLWELGGNNKLVPQEFKTETEALAVVLKAGDLVSLEKQHSKTADGKPITKYIVKTLVPDGSTKLSPNEYEAYVSDLVNYLDYMAEPIKNKRIRWGIVVLIFLCLVMLPLAYVLKHKYWKDLH